MGEFSFSKNDRLTSRKAIGELFDGGEPCFVFPLKFVYVKRKAVGEPRLKAAFSVSKRNFKRAVDRNYLKRLMRETYRLNKTVLAQALSETGEQMDVMFIYAIKELKEYKTVEKSMLKCLDKLKSCLFTSSTQSE
ncbi:MAG: ribonuclease P protein component [Mangrovibacterium sp.]